MNFVPPAIIAFTLTAVFMFAFRPVAKSIGLIDHPGGRKSYVGDVPITGGIAMLKSVLAEGESRLSEFEYCKYNI